MVCLRCKIVVKDVLSKVGINCITIELGELEIAESISTWQYNQINVLLRKSGLELIDDKKGILIQKIKTLVIDLVHYSEQPLTINLSDYLSQKLGYDYTYLSNLFSETTGSTIEKFFITHKIERVKELLVYNELTLTEIAGKMQYSSLAHLSAQFKKVTGLTASHFKRLKDKRRSMLEDV
jgi:AraC-like DNA-binding protein